MGQAFVICPRIEKSEEQDGATPGVKAKIDRRTIANLEMKSVKEEYERLRTKVFPDLKLAMLHGQMKGKEKEEIMRQFKDRSFDILVATSVVEVGVDVPNASIMLIEGAERFGLAQLYQFRGRVGRGEHQSYCFLMADSDAKRRTRGSRRRLKRRTALNLPRDLALRGPGQFFGEVQTGLPDVAMSALQDPDLVKASREAAIAIVQSDPSLKTYPPLKAKLAEFRKNIHLE